MFERKTILVVDNDDAMRSALSEQLGRDGRFIVWQARDATDGAALALAREPRFDAMVIDVHLPDGDGRDLCGRLRRHGLKVPIILLSAIDSEAGVVRGLEAGANDYVLKPFRMGELTARLVAHMRGFESSEDVAFRIGPYLFRPALRQLQLGSQGRRIRLTDKECGMLKFLYRANGAVVARHVLLQEVWGYHHDVDSHTVETHIYRLRRKIEPDPSRISLVVSESGGYRLSTETAMLTQMMAPRRPMASPATLERLAFG